MAATTTAAVTDRPLQLDSIPSIDLSLLSQSELHSLSLCSDSTFDLRRRDDVVIPKLNPSVFNESAAAASTTTIHRRTPHLRSHIPPSNSLSSSKHDPEEAENSKIIHFLKLLFKSDPNYTDFIPNEVECINPVTIVGKRKRGRPRKGEKIVNNVVKKVVVFNDVDDDRDKAIVNCKGVVVDMERLAELEDPYGPEISRRTAGMTTGDQLLGFLKGLNGKWGSRRKKKRVVDASDFGDALPKGWRLSLSIKKKVGQVWLFCRRYISPSGRQFASCRDVSVYLLSILGPQNSDKPTCTYSSNNNEHISNETSAKAADFVSQKDNSKIDTAVCYSSSLVNSLPRNHEKQVMSMIGNTVESQGEKFECPNCAMNLNGKDDLLQHNLLCHRRKRSKVGASLIDGVILKDGKYECQFCHKTFDERQRYNGHIGAHVRYEGKSVETPATPTAGKDACPFLSGGIPDGETMAQASKVVDFRVVTETFDVNFNNKVNTDSSERSKYKTCSSIETYVDNRVGDLNFMAHDKQDLQVNRNGSVLDEESFDNHVRNCITSNAKVCCTDEVPDIIAAKSDLGVACETSLSNNDNYSIGKPFGEKHIIDSANRTKKGFLGPEVSESCVVSTFRNGQTSDAVDNNVIGRSDDVEVLNEKAISEIGLLPSNTSGAMNRSGSPGDKDFTCTVDESILDTDKVANGNSLSGFRITPVGLNEEGVSKVKQQSSSETHSIVPQGSEEFIEKANGLIPSMKVDSDLKRSPVNNILIPSSDEDTHGVDRNSNTPSFSLPSTKLDSKHEILSNEGRSYTKSDAEDVTSLDKEKNSESNFPRGCEQSYSIENNVTEVSVGELVETHLNEFQAFENNEPDVPMDYNESGQKPSVMTIAKETDLEFSSLAPSGNEQTFDLLDDVTGIYDSAMEDCKDESSERGLLNHFCIAETSDGVFGNKLYNSPLDELKFDEDRDIGNHELSLAFGNRDRGLYANTTSVEQKRDLVNHSFVPSEIDQSFDVHTNLSMVNSNMIHDLKEGRGSMSDLFGLSCNNEPTNTFGNSINKNDMAGFGSNPYQPAEQAMPSVMWRTGEGNALQSRLDVPSHPLVQSPSCFRTFDIISDKAEDGFFRLGDKYNNGPGVNGFRSGRPEPVEFSFLTTHKSNSLQDNSKVFSYGTEMGQEFNPSFWLGKDAMMPNIAVNQITAICVWCRNEFQHDPGHSVIQGGIGTMCPTCSVRISQQVNIL